VSTVIGMSNDEVNKKEFIDHNQHSLFRNIELQCNVVCFEMT